MTNPGANSSRGAIERNAIALLSNYQRPVLYLPSPRWLETLLAACSCEAPAYMEPAPR